MRLLLPYHLDEHLPSLDVPYVPDRTITADLPVGSPWQRMAELYQTAAEVVADAVGAGSRPVVMSGDCTTSLATVAGLQRAGVDPAIVWFDGHGDVQTLETSASGYLGGMPLRILTGYRPELISNDLGLHPSRTIGWCWWTLGISTRPRPSTWRRRQSAAAMSTTSSPASFPAVPSACISTSTW